MAALLLLGGCESAEPPPTAPVTGLANPASVYCVEQGGRLDIVETAEGQVGFCTLPDGRRVEEWALFREAHEATDPPPSARSDAAPR